MNNSKTNNNYILSIIIPTRNREKYAFNCVMQILESTNDDVQVVIQDNSDADSLYDKFIDSPFLSRIKYNYSSEVLSFVVNFSNAVSQADGEYVCMIGDDDGINPEIVKFVYWAKENNIEAVTPEIRLNYIWPETGISYYKKDNGNLMIIDFNLNNKYYDTKQELNKLLSSGGQNYLSYSLVKIYHGIVKKSAMEKVKNITGKYFGGLSPDIYSSVALSLVIDKVLKINYPLTIPGVCSLSGSGQASTGRHVGDLKDAPQLKGHINYQWSQLVPKFYSVETIWADSALAALKDMKQDDLISKFSVSALTAYCNYTYKEYKKIIDANYIEYNKKRNFNFLKQKKNLYVAYLNGPIKDLLKRIYSRLIRKKNAVENHDGVLDIKNAQVVFEEFLQRKNQSINDVILKLDAV
ncbi:glycosyltransferase family 2 protein [Flavobacterium sp.]|uniref:glycosyltransferase family 2 protein n=1 Tax=Flavobacterium sp. TaxID=239 RepID=UPI0038FC5D0F